MEELESSLSSLGRASHLSCPVTANLRWGVVCAWPTLALFSEIQLLPGCFWLAVFVIRIFTFLLLFERSAYYIILWNSIE